MSKLTNTKRIWRGGILNFLRNKIVSLSSIAILTTTLMIIGVFFFMRGIFDYTLIQIKDKVDIKVYFKDSAGSLEIEKLIEKIQKLPQVKSAVLTSNEKVLADFKENHKNDSVILQALDEVNLNPFSNVLTISAQNVEGYNQISDFLNNDSSFIENNNSIIESVNYTELESTINKFTKIVNYVNVFGFWISILFIVMSALIIFNTIRLSIFIFKEEISIMRLVGASNIYIKGPFLIEAILFAFFSSLLSVILFYPVTYFISSKTKIFFDGLDIFSYYQSNFFSLFFVLLLISLILTTFSSLIAIRKYVKI